MPNKHNCTMSDVEKETFIVIPLERLSEDVFNGLVEEYILRDGTDYGTTELSLEEKKSRLMKQLKKGDVKVVYSSLTEDCTLIPSRNLKDL